jgi:hypothetical protein
MSTVVRLRSAESAAVTDAQVAGRARWGRNGRPDLLLIEFGEARCLDVIRRVLRESEHVRDVLVAGRVCRALADPGTGPGVAGDLRAQGLELAVVILQWGQDSPRQALPPSLTATPARISATAGSSHHQPNELAVSPTSTPPAIRAHSTFWVPSPVVAAEPRRLPSLRLAKPSSGMLTRLIVVTTMPSTVGAER